MNKPRSRVKNARRIQKLLRMLPDEITVDVKMSLKEAAEMIHADAMPNVPAPGSHPYATGNMLRNFRVRFSRSGMKAKIGFTRAAMHANIVEHGAAPHQIAMPDGRIIEHPGAPAQAFLWPAFRRNRRAAYMIMRGGVLRALNRAARLHLGDVE